MLKKTVSVLKQIAGYHKLKLASCAEIFDPLQFGIEPNACIDGDLINNLLGADFKFNKDRNQRKECRCVQSVDIGVYINNTAVTFECAVPSVEEFRLAVFYTISIFESYFSCSRLP